MIRFALKSALALGLLAMIVPLGRSADTDAAGIDVLGMLSGAQEAASDIGGFCGRAPAACEAGRELVVFTGDRIEAGARIGYAYLSDALASRPSETAAVTLFDRGALSDPIVTGGVDAMPLPRPYLPPKIGAAHARPVEAVAIPTPAPRT